MPGISVNRLEVVPDRLRIIPDFIVDKGHVVYGRKIRQGRVFLQVFTQFHTLVGKRQCLFPAVIVAQEMIIGIQEARLSAAVKSGIG
ncbi:hypothetical protein D9M68_836190 [compost metagenome]